MLKLINVLASASMFIATSALAGSYSELAVMENVSVFELASEDENIRKFKMITTVELGSNACIAAQNKVTLISEQVEQVKEVYALIAKPEIEKACTRIYDPVYKTISIIMELDETRSLDILLRNVDTPNNTASYQDYLKNDFCDSVDTAYIGGNPLFDQSTGEFLSLEDYLATKGMDLNCQY